MYYVIFNHLIYVLIYKVFVYIILTRIFTFYVNFLPANMLDVIFVAYFTCRLYQLITANVIFLFCGA